MSRINLILIVSLFLFSKITFAITVPSNVSAKWLNDNLNKPNLVIIEMSEIADYSFTGHIPGSVYTNKSYWRYRDSNGSLVHLPMNKLQNRIRELGINNNDGVVIYYKGNEANEILGAYYLFWLFHRVGHTNVGMLERGWNGWQRLNGKVDDIDPEITTSSFIVHPIPSLEIETKELDNIRQYYLLVDGRPKTHFSGVTKFDSNTKYGHIPESANQPWSDYVNKDKNGRFYVITPPIPPLMKQLKINPKQAILLTCLGGTGAAFNYTIFYLTGYQNLRLHDAGFRRWNQLQLPLIKTNNRK